jgi:translation initiation factor 2 beta subunit (eIF-2beta)/eIF-5
MHIQKVGLADEVASHQAADGRVTLYGRQLGMHCHACIAVHCVVSTCKAASTHMSYCVCS